MTDQEDVSKTKTEPIRGGNSRGVVTLVLGLVIMTIVFGLAIVLDRYDGGPNRNTAKQTTTKPQ
jgi:hypothetical protein